MRGLVGPALALWGLLCVTNAYAGPGSNSHPGSESAANMSLPSWRQDSAFSAIEYRTATKHGLGKIQGTQIPQVVEEDQISISHTPQGFLDKNAEYHTSSDITKQPYRHQHLREMHPTPPSTTAAAYTQKATEPSLVHLPISTDKAPSASDCSLHCSKRRLTTISNVTRIAKFSTRAVIVYSRGGRVLRTVRATQAPSATPSEKKSPGHLVENGNPILDFQHGHGHGLGEDHAEIPILPPGNSAPDREPSGFSQSRDRQRSFVEPVSIGEVHIEFPDIPPEHSYHAQDLDISDGNAVFLYLSEFLSLVQPNDFPIDLLRDVMEERTSIVTFILQSLQLEAGFIALSGVFLILALVAPCLCLSYACSRLCGGSGSGGRVTVTPPSGRRSAGKRSARVAATSPPDTPPNTPPPEPPADLAENLGIWRDRDNCRRHAVAVALHTLIVLLLLSISAQITTNQQVSASVSSAPVVVQTALSDMSALTRNTQEQITNLVKTSSHIAAEAVFQDLDNVHELLGKPLQRELAAETGLDVALDALFDVATVSMTHARKVTTLLESVGAAQEAATQVQDRLDELRAHVDALHRSCSRQDRPLCDTIHSTGLQVTLDLKSILTDARLSELRALGSRNVSALATQAKAQFLAVPQLVAHDTADARISLRRHLTERLNSLDDRLSPLSATSARVSGRLDSLKLQAMRFVQAAQEVDAWRWTATLGGSLLVMLPCSLLLIGALCLCCGSRDRAAVPLMSSVILSGLVSLPLWLAALALMLVAGHGEVFVCRPLLADTKYAMLSRIPDADSSLAALLYGNNSAPLAIKDVLRGCHYDEGAYGILGLRSTVDVEALTDLRFWPELNSELGEVRPNLGHLKFVSPQLQSDLRALLDASMVNLTEHRLEMSGRVTGKDLSALADQVESVANQIGDLATASRVETLASRIRRVHAIYVQPLVLRKENIIYQLTTMEVELAPLQRQVNQSLSHLKTIQYFIDKQGDTMANQKAEQFRMRIRNYLEQAHDHVHQALRSTVARCGPLWRSYYAITALLCRNVLDPLNGLWVSLVLSLLFLLLTTPFVLSLIRRSTRPALSVSPGHSPVLVNGARGAWVTGGSSSDGW